MAADRAFLPQVGGQGRGRAERPARDVHGQAVQRPGRLGLPRARLARARRRERVRRPRRSGRDQRRACARSWPACSCTRPRSWRCSTRPSTRTGGSSPTRSRRRTPTGAGTTARRCVRIPPERGGATRLEVRVGDGSANPYLAIAAILFAGLARRRARRCRSSRPWPATSPRPTPTMRGAPLPSSLEEALDALEADAVLRGRSWRREIDRHVRAAQAVRDRAPPRVGVRLGDRRVPPPPLRREAMSDATASVTLDDIDLTDHDAFVDARPARVVHAAAPRGPGALAARRPTGPGFWCVTRYDDIREVHRNPEVFSSELGGTSLEDLEPEDIEARKSMIDMDPPRHDELRGADQPPLHAARGRRRGRSRCARSPREVLDARAAAGRVRLRRRDQLGDPDAGVRRDPRRAAGGAALHHRARRPAARQARIPSTAIRRRTTRTATCRSRSPAALEMFEFGPRARRARGASSPRDDIVTQLAFEPLTQQEFDVYFILLATAGNETTRHTISHGLLALIEHPEQLAARCATTRRCSSPLPEEMLRWATPVHHFRRTAAERHRVRRPPDPGGRQGHDLVRVGQPRRDGLRGPAPRSTSAARRTRTWPSARAACTTAWAPTWPGSRSGSRSRSCCARVRSIELAGPAERLRSNFFNGIKRMPIRVELN